MTRTTDRTEAEPHWERGFRCHGYWLGGKRVGCVSLPPRLPSLNSYAKTDGYGWSLDSDDAQHPPPRLRFKTLRAAKRAVEKAYHKWANPTKFDKWRDGCGYSGEYGA